MLPHLKYALTREPGMNAADGITTSSHLGIPDFNLMLQQYDAYLDTLRQCGLSVTTLPADDRFPDGHFVEDPIVIFHDMAFISSSGALVRRGEADALADNLAHLRQIHIDGVGRLDGGDVLICADRVLIGISDRTNVDGANQLESALKIVQPDILVEQVYFSGVLHLKTGITELAPGVIVKSPLMETEHDFSFAEVITLPIEEAYAADVLPINNKLIIPAIYPTLAELANKHYTDVFMLEMTEFEKMDGGLTCLSLRY